MSKKMSNQRELNYDVIGTVSTGGAMATHAQQ